MSEPIKEKQEKTIVVIHPADPHLHTFGQYLEERLRDLKLTVSIEVYLNPAQGIDRVKQGGVDLVITNVGRGTDNNPEHYYGTLKEIVESGYEGRALVMTSRDDLHDLDNNVWREGLAIGAISSAAAFDDREKLDRLPKGIKELLEIGYSLIFSNLYGKREWPEPVKQG